MSEKDDQLNRELDEILKKVTSESFLDEEEALKVLLLECDQADINRAALKAMNRARYAMCLALTVLDTICDFRDVPQEKRVELFKAAMKDARVRMQNMYKIDLEKI